MDLDRQLQCQAFFDQQVVFADLYFARGLCEFERRVDTRQSVFERHFAQYSAKIKLLISLQLTRSRKTTGTPAAAVLKRDAVGRFIEFRDMRFAVWFP